MTDYTSNLIYQNESGALNEAFSDIMGTSVEFFFQPPGSGNLRADYLIGEDVFRPGGIRSLRRSAGASAIPITTRAASPAPPTTAACTSTPASRISAFYLAIEGGTNRTSGLSVQGVGAANREQIERVFYRAFTQMLPANATFAVARAATHPVGPGPLRREQRRRARGDASLDSGRCQLRRTRMRPAAARRSSADARCSATPRRHAAQSWPERVHVSVNGAFQATTNDFSDRFEFERNLETGSTDVDYPVQGGFVFDAGGGLPLLEEPCGGRRRSRISRETTARARRRAFRIRSSSISRAQVTGDATGVNADRNGRARAGDVPRQSRGHAAAASLSGGPSFFDVEQDLVTEVIDDRNLSRTTRPHSRRRRRAQRKGSAAAFNVGADVMWMFGKTVRRRRAGPLLAGHRSISTRRAIGPITVDAGGVYAGGGLRSCYSEFSRCQHSDQSALRRMDSVFTRRVLSVVRRIPAGRVATYGDVAAAAGRPRAARAVGNIMRDCGGPRRPGHRVIAAGGSLAATAAASR